VNLLEVDGIGAKRPQALLKSLPDPTWACVTDNAVNGWPEATFGRDYNVVTVAATQGFGQQPF